MFSFKKGLKINQFGNFLDFYSIVPTTCVAFMCVAYITICCPDEEQSGLVTFTMRVESENGNIRTKKKNIKH